MIVIARWESKSKKHWAELLQYDDGAFGYDAPQCGGVFGMVSLEQAVREMELRVASGYFQPDANRTPMTRVETLLGEGEQCSK